MFFKERVAAAREAGLLDEKLQPVSLPRKVDVEWATKLLKERSEDSRNRLRMLQEVNVVNGNQFEQRCELTGFVRGYDNAIEQVTELLLAMTVSPFPHASLKV